MKQLTICALVLMLIGHVFAWTHSPSSRTVAAGGETFTLTVSGTENYNWYAGSADGSWISVTKNSAKTFTVTVAANTSESSRSANVTINAFQADASSDNQFSWVNSQSCGITQDGTGGSSGGEAGDTPCATAEVAPLSIIADACGCVTSVTIVAEGTWTIAESIDWLSVDSTNGIGNSAVQLTIAPNTSDQGRSGLITIVDKTVALYQEAMIDPCGISNVVARQRYPYNGKVDIDYYVFGDVYKNAQDSGCLVSLAVTADDLQTGTHYVANEIEGDLSLSEGHHSIVWDLEKQGLTIKSDQVVFSVSCQTNAPLYCIVDLSSGSSATNYPVSYTNEIPGGSWSDVYRTSKLALRRIEPGSFTYEGNVITLTQPYYVSVFEMTGAQRSRICNVTVSDSMKPAGCWYYEIRGNGKGRGWPHSSEVDQDSLLGKLQPRTGLKFDLLTFAQWMYAYHAGTTTRYYWGDSDEQIGLYAWFDPYSTATKKVGSFLPNDWGLYDMSGNVYEWVLDRVLFNGYGKGSSYGPYIGFDPVGIDSYEYEWSNYYRAIVGGGQCHDSSDVLDPPSLGSDAGNDYCADSVRGNYLGIRLSLTMTQPSMGLDVTREKTSTISINTVDTTHAPKIEATISANLAFVEMMWENDWPIHYTIDDTEPTLATHVYTNAFSLSIRGAKTIKARAFGPNNETSEISTYEIAAPNAPTITPVDGTIIGSSVSVNISSDNPNATIYCTTDGTEPTTSSPVYKRFKASTKMTVKAIAVVDGMAWSETTTARYALGQCADPIITPTDGTVFNNSNYQVSIAKNGEKGVLRYTTDGSEPTESSPIYTAPFTISETTTIKAKTFDTEYFDSAIVSATLTRQWTKVATPVIHASETFSGTKQTVSLTCETEDSVIRYTTDGSEPNSHSKKYTVAFDVTGTTIVKAIAFKTDCTASDIATMEITKQWGIGDAMNDSDRQFTTDAETGWLRDTTVSHDGSESMKSGNIEDSQTSGIYSESILSTTVEGKGIVSFWWKASCEEDDDFEWDHGEFRVDGTVVTNINGTGGWINISHEITSSGSHTLSWVYCKDDFGLEEDDCIWVDEFCWQVNDPIPDLGNNPTAQQIEQALNGSIDTKLVNNITDGTTYGQYRDWASKVKAKGCSSAVGADAVRNAPNAWLSFALGSETLIETAPTDGDLKVDNFEPATESGKFDFTVSVKDIEVGSDAAADNLKKVFGLEGGTTLEPGGLSSDNVNITFGTPENGKVKFTAGPKNTSEGTFFMKVKMTP